MSGITTVQLESTLMPESVRRKEVANQLGSCPGLDRLGTLSFGAEGRPARQVSVLPQASHLVHLDRRILASLARQSHRATA